MAEKQEKFFAFTPEMLKQVTGDGAAINNMIKAITRQNKNLQSRIAICAASCVVHAVQHGDVTKATSLVDALEGWRTNALRQWFLDFGPFKWVKEENAEGKMVAGFKLDKERKDDFKTAYKDKEQFASKLLELPFWIYKPEAEFKPFNLMQQLAQLLARAENVRTNKDQTKAHHPDNNFEGLAELKAVFKALKAGDEAEGEEEEERIAA